MHAFASRVVPPGALGIHWFGQSSLAFKDAAGTIVQVDPYFPTERPDDRFIHAAPPLDETTLRTDVVLLTHNHRDHTWPDSCLSIHASFPHCRFVGPAESVENLASAGIARERLTTVTAGEQADLGGLVVHVVYAKPPAGVPADGIKPPDVQHFGYVVEMGGVRAYVSGDPINTFANHTELTDPIAALRPDIGFFTTHPSEGEFPFFDGSVKMVQAVGVKTAVPTHYQCFVKRNYDAQAWAASFPVDGPELLLIPFNRAVTYRP
jgi:L-ascorbate metabolism protein UlaG (beta-lactamase superfamily)